MPTASIAMRGLEALIDLVLCYLILYGVADATGNAAGAGFYLQNGPALLGIALCLGYFIVLEALFGLTLGKLVTNLRVVREEDGAPIGWRAATIRNLMRLVDGLVLYLVGFVAICVSRRRQRLGDMAAHTLVVRRNARR